MGEPVEVRRQAGVKAFDQIVMRDIAVLPPPDDAHLIGQAAVEEVVGFPDAGDDDASTDAYRLRLAATRHDHEALVILDEGDLQGRAKPFGCGVEDGIGLQDTFARRRFRTLRPPLVLIRTRKPCVLARRRLFG